MSLAGTDALTIGAEGNPLFVIGGDDLLQLRPRQHHLMRSGFGK
jgi:hypothetical protein